MVNTDVREHSNTIPDILIRNISGAYAEELERELMKVAKDKITKIVAEFIKAIHFIDKTDPTNLFNRTFEISIGENEFIKTKQGG